MLTLLHRIVSTLTSVFTSVYQVLRRAGKDIALSLVDLTHHVF